MTSAPREFNRDRARAFEIANEDFEIPFGKVDKQTIRLLDEARDLKDEWSTNTRAQPVIAPLRAPQQQSAAVLHQRGKKLLGTDCCSRCDEHKGVWQSCVVAPIYKNRALYSYACSNCIYYRRPSECSLRRRFEHRGGRAWDPSLTESVVQSGGLLAAIQQEAARQEQERLQREQQRLQQEQERLRQEQERQRQQQERLQQEQERQRREREIELETLRRNGRQPGLSVVIHPPHRATKRSCPVKPDRTMGWSKKLLMLSSLDPITAARREMEAFLEQLIAHEAVLRRHITRAELRNEVNSSMSWDLLSEMDASDSFGSTEGRY